MTYRTPIVVGDRVALAPHLDLWMAGCRYGTVTNIGLADTDRDRVLFYNVRLDTGRHVTLPHDALLGAVPETPMQRYDREWAESRNGDQTYKQVTR